MLAEDINLATRVSTSLLNSHIHADWSVPAGDLAWSCRRTLDHIVDTLLLYSSYVATKSRSRRSPIRNGDANASVQDLLAAMVAAGSILTHVCSATPPPARAFHPSGLSDANGFRAMACSEILTHTDDIARGLGLSFAPPQDLCERVNARVFPWAPSAHECPDRWLALKWCCGQIALPGRARLDELWWWHAAPIEEWDGTRNQRSAPPAWS